MPIIASLNTRKAGLRGIILIDIEQPQVNLFRLDIFHKTPGECQGHQQQQRRQDCKYKVSAEE